MNIVRIMLTSKENWSEWSRKVKHALIFNYFWIRICDSNTQPTKLIDAKELVVWNMKNNKAYALIVASFNEKVNCHISSIDDARNALKKVKDLYDSF